MIKLLDAPASNMEQDMLAMLGANVDSNAEQELQAKEEQNETEGEEKKAADDVAYFDACQGFSKP